MLICVSTPSPLKRKKLKNMAYPHYIKLQSSGADWNLPPPCVASTAAVFLEAKRQKLQGQLLPVLFVSHWAADAESAVFLKAVPAAEPEFPSHSFIHVQNEQLTRYVSLIATLSVKSERLSAGNGNQELWSPYKNCSSPMAQHFFRKQRIAII